MKKLLPLILLIIVNLSFANEGEVLAKQKACLGCHSVQHIGISYPPAFAKVAEKYKDNKDQVRHSIRYGKGKMPAHPLLTESEITLLTDYIFTLEIK